MRRILESRLFVSFLAASATGIYLYFQWPFPDNPMLGLIAEQKHYVYTGIVAAYTAMLFTTPMLVYASVFSFLYIFGTSVEQKKKSGRLPEFVPPELRQ